MWYVFFLFAAPAAIIGAAIYFACKKFGNPVPETEEEKAYWQAIK